MEASRNIMKPKKHPTAGRQKLENKAFLHRYKPEHNEAVKMAIIEENKFISEMLEQKTERSIQAKNQISKNVFGICNILN